MTIRRWEACFVIAMWGLSAVTAGADEGPQPAAIADSAAQLPTSTCRCAGDSGPTVDRIKQVLAEPLKTAGLEFTEEPLVNVVDFLQTEYNIPIQLDEVALEDAGLARDLPVTINVNRISLNAALRLLLKKHHLASMIADEVLIVTTPEEAESHLMPCVYDVRDLIGENKKDKAINSLVDVIVSTVASESWAINGRSGAEIKTLQPGLLVISQTRAVHDEIGGLLGLIRETLRQPVSRPAGEAAAATSADGFGMGRAEGGYGRGGEGMGSGYGEGGPDAYGGEMGGEPQPTGATPFD